MTRSDVPDPAIGSLIDKVEGFGQTYDRWLRRRLGDTQDGVTLARLRLLFLLHDLGRQKMSDLAKCAHVSPRTLTTLVDALEKEGLARRVAHDTDRRATIVEITPAGFTAVETKSGPYWAAKNFLFSSLSMDERRLMSEIWDRWERLLAADMKAMDAAGG